MQRNTAICLAAVALFAAGSASAQPSSLTAPNNSAGSPLDKSFIEDRGPDGLTADPVAREAFFGTAIC